MENTNIVNVRCTCPLCETRLEYQVQRGMRLIMCDDERGGCGQYFAAYVYVEATSKIYKLEEKGESE